MSAEENGGRNENEDSAASEMDIEKKERNSKEERRYRSFWKKMKRRSRPRLKD